MNRHKHPPAYQFSSNDDLVGWLDSIPLSQLVHNLGTDFADGLLVAEIVGYVFPEYVDFSLFQAARNMAQRVKNWRLLNSKVLPKIDLHIPGTVVHDIINENPRSIELFLVRLREKLEEHAFRIGRRSSWPWETWRSVHPDRYHLPQIFLTSRQTAALLPSYGSLARTGRTMDSYDNDPVELLKTKENEIEILHAKLKRCEKVIHAQDKRIQDLEDKIVKLKSK